MPRSVDTVLTINPDGTISADFTGHISAQGIDMLAGTAASPPSDRRIRWHKDTLTGGVVADTYAYSSGITSIDTSFATLEATQIGAEGTELLLATKLGNVLASYIDIVSGPQATFGPAKITARASDPTATGFVVTIIDSNNRSSFRQRTEFRAGGLSNAGAVNYGSGFTSSRTGVGTYVVSFNVAFSGAYTLQFGSDNGSPQVTYFTASNVNGFTCQTVNLAGVAIDAFINFRAEGV